MQKKWQTYCLLIGLLAAGGCQHYLPVSSDWQFLSAPVGQGLVGRFKSPIPDVLMPIGFVPVVAKCHASIDQGIRQVNHVYQGRSSVQEIVDFYRHQQQLAHWLIVRETTENTQYILYFEKGRETLRIAVQKQGIVATIDITIEAK